MRARTGYVIAGIGAFVSLIGFFVFAYIEYSYRWYGGEDPGGSSNALALAAQEPFLWSEIVLPIAVLIITVLYLLDRDPFPNLRKSFLLLTLGVLSVIIHGYGVGLYYINFLPVKNFCHLLICGDENVNMLQYAPGYWLYLIGAIVITVGAVLALYTEVFAQQPKKSYSEDALFTPEGMSRSSVFRDRPSHTERGYYE